MALTKQKKSNHLVIDAHVHHYPPTLIHNPQQFALTHNEPYFGQLIRSKLQGFSTTEQLLQAMDVAGIDQAIILGWYWENQSTCEQMNAFQAQCIQAHPERFKAFAAIQPLAGKDALDGLKRAVDQGHVGIGEVCPPAQGFGMQDPSWLRIVEFAIEHKLPINLHVTDPLTHDYPGKIETPFQDYAWLATEYPEAILILAHLGGLIAFHELNAHFASIASNIYYDTAAWPLLYDTQVLSLLTQLLPPHKLIYGSDHPLRSLPKANPEPCLEPLIQAIHECHLPPNVEAQLLGGNIQRLLNLNKPKHTCN